MKRFAVLLVGLLALGLSEGLVEAVVRGAEALLQP